MFGGGFGGFEYREPERKHIQPVQRKAAVHDR